MSVTVVFVLLATMVGWTAAAAVTFWLDRSRDRAAERRVELERRGEEVTPRRMRLYVLSEDGREDVTLEGVFVGYEASHYRLASASHITTSDAPVPLEGEAWIPQARVLYAQIIG